uniref:Uncharacterized protein n=1 Tax=Branchiostoma floridae TaxID=7739 RepID=C3Y9F9_BRAFL|eukprot:XP_002607205.1 hypothetical protein BRAFLDRAFT_67997 [Branchiostoma floridae]
MEDKEKQPADGRNEEANRKYEDADLHDCGIFVLDPGLKKLCDEDLGGRIEPPPLPARNSRHVDLEDKEKEKVDGKNEETNRKYKDVDPAGYSVFASSSGPKKQDGTDTDGRNEPPPLPARNFRHLRMEDKEKEDVDGRNEETNRKYEDLDPAGYSVFASSSGPKKQDVPQTFSAGKLKDVDPRDESLLRSGSRCAAQHLDMGDHVVECLEHTEEPSTDTSYTSAETSGDGDTDEPGFCYKVRGLVLDLWNKIKSSSAWKVITVCAVLVTGLLFIAEGVVPVGLFLGTNAKDSLAIGKKLENLRNPWEEAFDKENSSDVFFLTGPASAFSSKSGTSWTAVYEDNSSVDVVLTTLPLMSRLESTEPYTHTTVMDVTSPVTPTLLLSTTDRCYTNKAVSKDRKSSEGVQSDTEPTVKNRQGPQRRW